MRKKYLPLAAPYIEAFHRGDKQRPTAIIIRSSRVPSIKGSAFGRANMWHRKSSPIESFHYIVDEEQTFKCVPCDKVAFSDGKLDKRAISINLCMQPLDSLALWDDQVHAKLLERVVELAAHLLLAYKIRSRCLDAHDEDKWRSWRSRSRGGVIVDIEGAWPVTTFVNDLSNRVASLKS